MSRQHHAFYSMYVGFTNITRQLYTYYKTSLTKVLSDRLSTKAHSYIVCYQIHASYVVILLAIIKPMMHAMFYISKCYMHV